MKKQEIENYKNLVKVKEDLINQQFQKLKSKLEDEFSTNMTRNSTNSRSLDVTPNRNKKASCINI